MRRKTAHPYGQSISGIRLVSMLMAILVLWMLYHRLKDPATWKGFASDDDSSVTKLEAATSAEPEYLVPGPNDQDESEVADIQELFEFVTDRAPLKSREMGAYWRLMDWGRTQPFTHLEQRARNDVPFTQLWEQPERYRGQPIRLRLHVRRVLQYDAPENPSGIEKVCEAWGWTDESRSFPYVVVFPEPPPGLPIGTDIRAEIVFVGYFLKVMTYTAFDHSRGAPLLVGRARLISTPAAATSSKSDPWIILMVVVGGICLIGFSVWTGIRARGKSKLRMLPDELSVVGTLDGSDTNNPFGHFVAAEHMSEKDVAINFDITSDEQTQSSSNRKT